MNQRRRLTGVVTSNKMQKTVVVQISRTFRHPLYRKVVHTFHKVKAHDELGCEIGDEVQIVESQPLSAQKRWVVETIVKRQAAPVMTEAESRAIDVEPIESQVEVEAAAEAEPVEAEAETVDAEPAETEPGQGE